MGMTDGLVCCIAQGMSQVALSCAKMVIRRVVDSMWRVMGVMLHARASGG